MQSTLLVPTAREAAFLQFGIREPENALRLAGFLFGTLNEWAFPLYLLRALDDASAN
jgi:hypothetical protein